MLHRTSLLMSWLTGKRAHNLLISCLFSLTQVTCLLLSSISLLYRICYINIRILCLYIVLFFIFCSTFFFLALKLVLCPAVTLLLSLTPFWRFLLPPLLLLVSSSPSPPLYLAPRHLFCAMPQGPPGPQGSPHPQPPPPNSMMGPHSQVTLPFPLCGFFLCFLLSVAIRERWFSASRFGIRLSSVLHAAF